MLYEIMIYIRNFFLGESREDKFVITDGGITLPFVVEGQYILIEGSKFNDGVYKYPSELTDETFKGTITALNPPKEFLNLVAEIEEWESNNKANVYISESFGGYSYTKASGQTGAPITWREAFASRLNTWRKK